VSVATLTITYFLRITALSHHFHPLIGIKGMVECITARLPCN
jgi:hypothetical protein